TRPVGPPRAPPSCPAPRSRGRPLPPTPPGRATATIAQTSAATERRPPRGRSDVGTLERSTPRARYFRYFPAVILRFLPDCRCHGGGPRCAETFFGWRPSMRILAMDEKRRVGRPANPESRRMHVWINSTVKRRIVRCAVQNGLPLHELVDTALRQYLTRRRMM